MLNPYGNSGRQRAKLTVWAVWSVAL